MASTYVSGGTLDKVNEVGTMDKLNTIGTIKKIERVSIAAFPCPKVTDKGLTGGWWLADKIALAVALWATHESWKAAKEDYEIGKRYYNMAKEQWDFFYKAYRPLEEQELDEMWAEGEYTPDYGTATKGHTGLIDAVFTRADNHRQALASKYCVCDDVAQFTKTELVKSTVYGDSDNFARRYAEKLAQERNDTRWNRRTQAASRGRGMLAQSASFAAKASGFFGDYAKAMGGLAGNAQRFRGYLAERFETEYNPARRRVDGRADVPNYQYGNNNYIGTYSTIPTTGMSTGGVAWTGGSGLPMAQSAGGLDPAGIISVHNASPY